MRSLKQVERLSGLASLEVKAISQHRVVRATRKEGLISVSCHCLKKSIQVRTIRVTIATRIKASVHLVFSILLLLYLTGINQRRIIKDRIL